MMTTAILIFLGLSSCATLAIVTAVIVGARRSIPSTDAVACDEATAVQGSGSKASWVPAYNH